MKMRHEDEMVRTEREHEEKVLFLLGQLSGTPATNTNAQVTPTDEQHNGNFNIASQCMVELMFSQVRHLSKTLLYVLYSIYLHIFYITKDNFFINYTHNLHFTHNFFITLEINSNQNLLLPLYLIAFFINS